MTHVHEITYEIEAKSWFGVADFKYKKSNEIIENLLQEIRQKERARGVEVLVESSKMMFQPKRIKEIKFVTTDKKTSGFIYYVPPDQKHELPARVKADIYGDHGTADYWRDYQHLLYHVSS